MQSVDYKKPFQVFPCRDPPNPGSFGSDMQFTVKKSLGRGGQGQVDLVQIELVRGKKEKSDNQVNGNSNTLEMADKNCQILDNLQLFKKALRTYMCEFYLANSLDHPNVLKYKYLVR